MDLPYRVEVLARVGRHTLDGDVEIGVAREDVPDTICRLIGQLQARNHDQIAVAYEAKAVEMPRRDAELYRLARRPEERLRALVGESR